jgi:hypothetical protein
VGLRDRLKKLQRAVEGEAVTLNLLDGTTARFTEEELGRELFLHEGGRGRRHFEGEEPGPAHPFVEALRNAAPGEVERLVPTQGTMILHFLGEDAIMRGARERPGPPVEWNGDKTVCR